MFQKQPSKTKKKPKSSPIRRSANGQDCQVRLPGICTNRNVVLGHRNGGGVGRKRPDYQAAYICESCHAVVDGAVRVDLEPNLLLVYFYEAIFNTQEILVSEGFIEYQGI